MKKTKIILGLLAAFSLVFMSCDPATGSTDGTSAPSTSNDTTSDDTTSDDVTNDTVDLQFPITIVSDGTILKEGVKLTFNEDKTCVAVSGTTSLTGTYTIRKSFIIAKVPMEGFDGMYLNIAYQITEDKSLIPYTLDLSKAVIGWGDDVSISTAAGKLVITNTSDKWYQVAIPYNPDVAPAKALIPLSNDSTDNFRVGITKDPWSTADNEKGYSVYSEDSSINLDSEHSYVVIKGNGNKVSTINSILVSWAETDYSKDKDIYISDEENGKVIVSDGWTTAFTLYNEYDLTEYKYLNIETYIEGDVIENSNVTLKCLDFWGQGANEVGLISKDNVDFARTPTTYQTEFGSESTNKFKAIQIFALNKDDWSPIKGVKVHILKVTATNKKLEQE